MKTTNTFLATALTSLITSNLMAADLVESRGDWLRGTWGINWKPVDVFNGKSEQLSIDQLLTQISGLKTVDYIQLHLKVTLIAMVS